MEGAIDGQGRAGIVWDQFFLLCDSHSVYLRGTQQCCRWCWDREVEAGGSVASWVLQAGTNKPLRVATKGEQSCGSSVSSLLFLFVLALLGLCSAGGF